MPEARPQQVAALREDAVEVIAAPLEAFLRHLNGERHLRPRRLHIQLGEQAGQVRVSALIEDEEAGVDAVVDAIKLDVDRVGMTAEMTTGFKERDMRCRSQCMRHGQARDAGANHGHALHRPAPAGKSPRQEKGVPPPTVPLAVKTVVRRPGTNEEGREEENRSGIVAGETGSPHNRENFISPPSQQAELPVQMPRQSRSSAGSRAPG